jgi:anti-sigma regulatory factor (Ser/Thr protein kinase)
MSEDAYPATGAVLRALSTGSLSQLRALATAAARDAGLTGDRVDQFAVALDEAMANAIQHAGGGTLRIQVVAGSAVMCEVTDHGPGIPAGTAPQLMPPPGSVRGRGLPLMHLLCDRVQIRTGPTGTTIALTMDLSGADA